MLPLENCVNLVSVHPLRVPTLKMAVWLFLPCAGGPDSGRKSDAQKQFPRIQDAQSHAYCLLHFKSTTVMLYYVEMHLFTKHKNLLIAPVCSVDYSFFGYVTHPSIHRDVSHHESRLDERRVAAQNDRCLFAALQMPHSDSFGAGGLL